MVSLSTASNPTSLSFCHYCFNCSILILLEVIPKSWRVSLLQPLYKNKGDEKNPDNYRGLALGNSFLKVFTSVLQARLYKWTVKNKKIPQNQFNFVRNRSTIDAVQALKTQVAAKFKTNKQTYVCYVDFSKTFDTVVRNQLLEKLKNNG